VCCYLLTSLHESFYFWLVLEIKHLFHTVFPDKLPRTTFFHSFFATLPFGELFIDAVSDTDYIVPTVRMTNE
jgi:hypothetical protein